MGGVVEYAKRFWDPYSYITGLFHVAMIVLFWTTVDYDINFDPITQKGVGDAVDSYYTFYTGVTIMVLIGFGYLMTFLKKYRYGAVGLNFFYSCFVFLWSLLCAGFFQDATKPNWVTIDLTIVSLINGMFCAASCMITFGGLIGFTSPDQLTLMFFFEVMFYNLNAWLVYDKLLALDIGGSMTIHLFGAYFGLTISFFLNPGKEKAQPDENWGAAYDSDFTSLIGTIFLWIMWPSFNGALAPNFSQFRVIINTILSLSASVVVAFLASRVFRGHHGHYEMEDIQNATLAGGVAIGGSADLVISPGGALTVGTVAGLISVFGYTFVTPFLRRTINLRDPCGIHNLHAVPGLMGGIASIITARVAAYDKSIYGVPYTDVFHRGADQWRFQVAALFTCFGFAVIGAICTGVFIRLLMWAKIVKTPKRYMTDEEFWVIPKEN